MMRIIQWIGVIAVALQAALLATEVFAPFLVGDFSLKAWESVGSTVLFFGALIPLGLFYKEVNKVHLSYFRRGAVDVLLCLGGVGYVGSIVLMKLSRYPGALVLLCLGILLLWCAKLMAAAFSSSPKGR